MPRATDCPCGHPPGIRRIQGDAGWVVEHCCFVALGTTEDDAIDLWNERGTIYVERNRFQTASKTKKVRK